jgi:Chaperone of endosialidase
MDKLHGVKAVTIEWGCRMSALRIEPRILSTLECNQCSQQSSYKNMKPTKTTTPLIRNSISPATAERGFLLITLAMLSFALLPMAQAQLNPPPDGGYPNFNTAEGDGTLFSLRSGADNTALGYAALNSNTTGYSNTATGALALLNNSSGHENTANGVNALTSNRTGFNNTATGDGALQSNSEGINNTATGFEALQSNSFFNGVYGNNNTANGAFALQSNSSGNNNTAEGFEALQSNTEGGANTANGFAALFSNTTGGGNIAVGFSAGANLTTGSNNIDIGNLGAAGESKHIRIGTKGTHTNTFIAGISGVTVAGGVGVIIDINGHLGTVSSSARFKDEIKPMDKASEAILALKPVTFRYKHEFDPEGIPQFGLVAEQVEKVNPDLVARDAEGKVNTVRYEAVNAMLLNEFLKEHRKVQEQETTITQVKSTVAKQEVTIAQQQKDFQSTIAQQQKQIETLTAGLQKVSAQVQLKQPSPQIAVKSQ